MQEESFDSFQTNFCPCQSTTCPTLGYSQPNQSWSLAIGEFNLNFYTQSLIQMNSLSPDSQTQTEIHLYEPQCSKHSGNSAFLNPTNEEGRNNEDPFICEQGQFTFFLPQHKTSNQQKTEYCQKESPHRTNVFKDDQSSQDQRPVISKFISINGDQEDLSILQNNQEETDTTRAQNLLISKDQDDSNQQDSMKAQHSNLIQNQSRSDDSNNADKKIITALNSCLTKAQKKLLKKKIAQAKEGQNVSLKIVKSSRYGFVQELIILKHFFGTEFVLQLFKKFKAQLSKFEDQIKTKKTLSQSQEYLLTLPAYYIKSYMIFLETNGDIEESMEAIYKRSENFKQDKYYRKGIQEVIKLQKELQSLSK